MSSNEDCAGSWIETASGHLFHPENPTPEEIYLPDIPVALSNLCRYGGQIEKFYSVAQHSALMSLIVPREEMLRALFHDAAEAYLVDVPRPLKPLLRGYKELERRIAGVISLRMGKPENWLQDLPICIHDADNAMLLAERRDLRVQTTNDWGIYVEPASLPVIPLPPYEARRMFVTRAQQLGMSIADLVEIGANLKV